jgi:hypothetical protein
LLTEQNRHLIRRRIRDHQIRDAVSVEIADGDRGGTNSGWEDGWGRKTALTIAK